MPPAGLPIQRHCRAVGGVDGAEGIEPPDLPRGASPLWQAARQLHPPPRPKGWETLRAPRGRAFLPTSTARCPLEPGAPGGAVRVPGVEPGPPAFPAGDLQDQLLRAPRWPLDRSTPIRSTGPSPVRNGPVPARTTTTRWNATRKSRGAVGLFSPADGRPTGEVRGTTEDPTALRPLRNGLLLVPLSTSRARLQFYRLNGDEVTRCCASGGFSCGMTSTVSQQAQRRSGLPGSPTVTRPRGHTRRCCDVTGRI